MNNKITALKNRTKELFQGFCGKGGLTSQQGGEQFNNIAGMSPIAVTPNLGSFLEADKIQLHEGEGKLFDKMCKGFGIDSSQEVSNEQFTEHLIALSNIERGI